MVLIGVFSVTNFYCEDVTKSQDYKLGMKSAASADLGKQIWLFAKTECNRIEPSAVLYFKAGDNAVLLTIYGIEAKTERTKLVEMIEAEQKRQNWRTIYIEFRKSEVWIEKDNGVKERGAEEILATTTLASEAKP